MLVLALNVASLRQATAYVTQDTFDSLMLADSQGQYFLRNIRDQHAAQKQ